MIKEIKNTISESIDNIQTFINDKRESITDKADINTEKKTNYEDRTKEEIYELAKDKDIDGRSYMNKDELIDAVRETRH